MASGGARNRSGPQPDPSSLRTEQRGLVYTALPREGYAGELPAFPLPPMVIRRWETEDKHRYQVPDLDATSAFRERELALWALAWSFPQACVWAVEPWRQPAVAMWVRTTVICESSDSTAADKGSVHRFADQVGLTPAGLKENGWAIAKDQVAERRAKTPAASRSSTSARSRMKVVPGGTGA